MWTADDFPGADKVPWQLLIRARYVDEVDAFVATTVVAQVRRVASLDVATRVATVAAEAVRGGEVEKLGRASRLEAMGAVADFIDICPPWPPWPFPWPWPGPWPWPWAERENPFEQIATPYQHVVLRGATELVNRAGSPRLQEQLGGVLKELGGF